MSLKAYPLVNYYAVQSFSETLSFIRGFSQNFLVLL